MSEIVRVPPVVAVSEHRCCDLIGVPDLRISVPLADYLRRVGENLVARLGSDAESDVRVRRVGVPYRGQEMPGQLVFDRVSVRVPPADHEAGSRPGAHVVHVLETEAVDKLLCRCLVENSRLNVAAVVGKQVLIRTPGGIDAVEAVKEEMHALQSLAEGARGLCRDVIKRFGELKEVFTLTPVRFRSEAARLVSIVFLERQYSFKLDYAALMKLVALDIPTVREVKRVPECFLLFYKPLDSERKQLFVVKRHMIRASSRIWYRAGKLAVFIELLSLVLSEVREIRLTDNELAGDYDRL